MPKDAMSLEDWKMQKEAMEKNIVDLEKQLRLRDQQIKDIQATNSALVITMQEFMKQAEKEKKALTEEFNEDKARLTKEFNEGKARLEDQIRKLETGCDLVSVQEDPEEDCESVSAASKATSKVTMFSTDHSRMAAAEHGISRTEVQKVIKHGGEGFLQENGCRRVSFDGNPVILDKDRPVVVTVHPEDSDVPAEDQDWEQVGKHRKQRTRELPRVGICSDGSVIPILISLNEEIEKFMRENPSLNERATRRLGSVRGLEARMVQTDLEELLEPFSNGTRNCSAALASRVKNLFESIAAQWRADEVEEYTHLHGVRGDVSEMLCRLPKGKREKVMHETSFFDARDKTAVLLQCIRAV